MPTGQSKSSAAGAITAIQREVSVDPASIAAATTAATSVASPGAQVGDLVQAQPRAALTAGIVVAYARVSSADTIALVLGNVTAGAIDLAAGTWDIRVERVAPS